MELQIVSLKTSQLSKEIGFNWKVEVYFEKTSIDKWSLVNDFEAGAYNYNTINTLLNKETISCPIQELLQKYIREKHNILISIYNNASGYLWNMAQTAGGTDIGYSEFTGPNESGVWDKYEDALENALIIALNKIKQSRNATTTS